MRKIVGQVIVLTKNIWLASPIAEPGYMAQFMIGERRGFGFGGGLGLSWWYTRTTFKTVESIASMIVESMREFEDCDLDSVEGVINNTLKKICMDRRVFIPDDVCFARKSTLFECHSSTNTSQFGSLILDAIVENLKGQLIKWCTVYTTPRLSGPSFGIADAGISVFNREDERAGDAILQKSYQTNGWHLAKANGSPDEKTIFRTLQHDYVFLCKESGTQKGTKFASALKLRRLFAVIFAAISEHRETGFKKSAGDPYRACFQFPGTSGKNVSITMSEIGALVPYYIDHHVLLQDDIVDIQKWFALMNEINGESSNRIEKCAHFINKAMNSEDIESYVNYFVALDALFGERGAVEASIMTGIQSLGLNGSIEEKATWLFDLRNELVHGGSRYIQEWPKYRRYYRHFDSKPDLDIEKLAFAAIFRAPKLFA